MKQTVQVIFSTPGDMNFMLQGKLHYCFLLTFFSIFLFLCLDCRSVFPVKAAMALNCHHMSNNREITCTSKEQIEKVQDI
jgi:hypothetical protein